MGEVRDIQCPITGDVVYLDVAILRRLHPTPIVCPSCHEVHIWQPHGMELLDLSPIEHGRARTKAKRLQVS
jgi:hypothetical protein